MALTPLPAPQWHIGEWWRVRVHECYATFSKPGGAVTLHDAPDRFRVYRYTVVGQYTLRYRMGDRFGHHIGAAVPPERCWAVQLRLESAPPGEAINQHVSELAYRTSDLTLLCIVDDPQNGKRRSFRLGRPPGEARPHPVVPFSFGEPISWPQFPLTDVQASQRVLPLPPNGTPVIFFKGEDTITQDWHPGRPWWDHADRNGRENSDLIETSEDKNHTAKATPAAHQVK